MSSLYGALNARQKRMHDALLEGASICGAYVAAGYTGDPHGAAPHSVLAKIQAALDESQAKVAAKSLVTAERILEEIDAIALATLRGVASWGGSVLEPGEDGSLPHLLDLVASGEISAAAAAAVKAVKVSSKGQVTVEMHDKVRALELAARVRGLLTDRQVVAFEEPVRLYVPEPDAKIPGAADGDG